MQLARYQLASGIPLQIRTPLATSASNLVALPHNCAIERIDFRWIPYLLISIVCHRMRAFAAGLEKFMCNVFLPEAVHGSLAERNGRSNLEHGRIPSSSVRSGTTNGLDAMDQ